MLSCKRTLPPSLSLSLSVSLSLSLSLSHTHTLSHSHSRSHSHSHSHPPLSSRTTSLPLFYARGCRGDAVSGEGIYCDTLSSMAGGRLSHDGSRTSVLVEAIKRKLNGFIADEMVPPTWDGYQVWPLLCVWLLRSALPPNVCLTRCGCSGSASRAILLRYVVCSRYSPRTSVARVSALTALLWCA
jgi:hypothetical protein